MQANSHQPTPWRSWTLTVSMLARRCSQYPRARVDRRASLGNDLKQLLSECVAIPGRHAEEHSYWVFPVVVDDSEKTIALLRDSGFDATRSHNLTLLENASDRLGREAPVLRQLLRKIVFLPMYPEMTSVAIQKMARVLSQQAEPNMRKREPSKIKTLQTNPNFSPSGIQRT